MNWRIDGTESAEGASPRHLAVVFCVAGSLALHAAVIGMALKPTPHAAFNVSARMQFSSPSLRPPPHARATALSDSRQEAAEVSESSPASLATAPAPANEDSNAALSPGSASSPVEDHSNTSVAFSEYIPRAHLTMTPVPRTSIVLEPPPGADAAEEQRVGVLLLYIDERGEVRDAIAQEPLLPEAYERVAQDAFMAARFWPGEFEGRPVKSSLRVEVIFAKSELQY